jgi:hypothetical protein
MAGDLSVQEGVCQELSRITQALEAVLSLQTIAHRARCEPVRTEETKFAWLLQECVDCSCLSMISRPVLLLIVALQVAQRLRELCRPKTVVYVLA